MTPSLRHFVALGALGLAAIGPGAVSAAPADALAKAQMQTYPGEAYSQYRGRHYGGYRGGYRRGGGGAGVAAGVIGGLAAGALIGGAIASQAAPGPGYYAGPGAPVAAYGGPVPVGNVYGRDPNWVNYCASRYRSFDPVSGTYLGRDGFRYPCE
ncbi:BA14K family protein [uncultured Enterovirga sp.]|uniref:BA14K family protein n=1 Tax=uncultured Enterovirga sp. TaxID=2026352 RepID=UPI0035CA2224